MLSGPAEHRPFESSRSQRRGPRQDGERRGSSKQRLAEQEFRKTATKPADEGKGATDACRQGRVSLPEQIPGTSRQHDPALEAIRWPCQQCAGRDGPVPVHRVVGWSPNVPVTNDRLLDTANWAD